MTVADIVSLVTPAIDAVVDAFGVAQGWLFQTIVNPLVYHLGFGEFTEEAFEGTEWLLIGLCELVLLFLVLRPLEALIPAQKMTDPRARWNDFIYTVLHRIGLFSVVVFFTLDPLMDALAGALRLRFGLTSGASSHASASIFAATLAGTLSALPKPGP